jgi:hypothetical protein
VPQSALCDTRSDSCYDVRSGGRLCDAAGMCVGMSTVMRNEALRCGKCATMGAEIRTWMHRDSMRGYIVTNSDA